MAETPVGQRTLLGFDFGTQRIGVAVGQEVTTQARALTTLRAVKHKPDWEGISRLIEEWQPDLLVVGLPLHLDGNEQDMTRAAQRFANQLNGRYRLKVELMDERLTSDEAESLLTASGASVFQDKAQVDMIAAQLILQSWMELQQNT